MAAPAWQPSESRNIISQSKTKADQLIAFIGAVKSEKIEEVRHSIPQDEGLIDALVHGWTALTIAAAQGNEEILRLLIQHNANLDQKNLNGNTALIAAILEERLICARVLCTAGAEINERNSKGETAILHAVKLGNIDIIKLLIKYNASITIKDENGYSPLVFAVEYGYAEVVQLLLARAKKLRIDIFNITECPSPYHDTLYDCAEGDMTILQILREAHEEKSTHVKHVKKPINLRI